MPRMDIYKTAQELRHSRPICKLPKRMRFIGQALSIFNKVHQKKYIKGLKKVKNAT
jgi:hypothetical protein